MKILEQTNKKNWNKRSNNNQKNKNKKLYKSRKKVSKIFFLFNWTDHPRGKKTGGKENIEHIMENGKKDKIKL